MNTEPGRRVPALLTLALGAVCISFAPVFVKLVGMERMGPTSIGFWRTLFGAGILFTWAALRRQRLTMPASVLRWCVAAGFFFFLDLSFWHRSILYSGAGMATILANNQVFVTALLGFLIFKEKLGAKFLAAAACAVLGVVLLVGVGSEVEMTARYLRGVVFGLLTAVVYASYIAILKVAGHADRRPGFVTLMAWISLFTALFTGLGGAALERGKNLPPDLFSLVMLLALALVAQALGWWLISSSLPGMAGSRGGLALLLQPVLATLWGVFFFQEVLVPLQIAGAGITLAAVYVGSARS